MKKNKEPQSLLTDEDVKPENIKANITIRVSGDLQGYRNRPRWPIFVPLCQNVRRTFC